MDKPKTLSSLIEFVTHTPDKLYDKEASML